MSLKGIAIEINKDRVGREYSEKKIANVVRKILGFEIEQKGHEKLRMVVIKECEKLTELCEYYGLPLPQEPSASSASSNGAIHSPNSADDKNDENIDDPQQEMMTLDN